MACDRIEQLFTVPTGGHMKSVSALALVLAAMFLFAPPASAYIVDLNVWNITDSNGNPITDHITVNISAGSITFTFVGGGLTNAFQAMKDIFFQPAVFTGANSITGVPSPYSLSCGSASGGGSCNADGFTINPAGAE